MKLPVPVRGGSRGTSQLRRRVKQYLSSEKD